MWTLRELKRALGHDAVGKDANLGRISIDSRTLKEGDIYLALKREKDGHDYIEAALDAGASYVISEKSYGYDDPQILMVSSTDKALSDLAEARRDWAYLQRIAVTGSVGKTTCKNMLSDALGAYSSIKSFNNHIGVPLTLSNTPKGKSFGVFEIGMNHPGEILPLAELVKPSISIITSVAPAHIEAFNTLEDIAVEKFSILHGLEPGGVLITTAECYKAYKAYVPEGVKVLTIADEDTAGVDACVISVKRGGHGYTLAVSIMNELFTLSVQDVSPAFMQNALLTLLCVKHLGAPMEKALATLENYTPVEGRGNIEIVDGITVIDDSYNANPLSMKAALDRALSMKPASGHAFAIVGQMGELGTRSDELHKALAETVNKFDGVYVVGEAAQVLYNDLNPDVKKGFYASGDRLPYDEISSLLHDGDIIVIKGSKVITYTTEVVKNLKTAIQNKAKEKHAV